MKSINLFGFNNKYIICRRFTSSVTKIPKGNSDFNITPKSPKYQLTNSKLTITLEDEVFKDSIYYLVIEPGKIRWMDISDLKKQSKEELIKKEVPLIMNENGSKSISVDFIFDDNKLFFVRLISRNKQNLDYWWAYDIIPMGSSYKEESISSSSDQNTKNNEGLSAPVIHIIIISSIIILVGLIFLIRYCIVKRKRANDSQNRLLK